jgi:serine/threonine-protein kinase HipA
VATWREVALASGAHPAEIKRMASAFEHNDLARAQTM